MSEAFFEKKNNQCSEHDRKRSGNEKKKEIPEHCAMCTDTNNKQDHNMIWWMSFADKCVHWCESSEWGERICYDNDCIVCASPPNHFHSLFQQQTNYFKPCLQNASSHRVYCINSSAHCLQHHICLHKLAGKWENVLAETGEMLNGWTESKLINYGLNCYLSSTLNVGSRAR